MKKLIVATNNEHKLQEIKDVFGDTVEVLGLKEANIDSDPEEDADTFEGNARIKAKAAWEKADHCAVLADDSGLEVDALGGDPGVHSARYAGPDCDDEANNSKLLKELCGIAPDDRTARFVTVMVLIDEDGEEYISKGFVEGKIGFEERGEEGFGYDPLFFPDEFGGDMTFAEMPMTDKNKISHRSRALNNMKRQISETLC